MNRRAFPFFIRQAHPNDVPALNRLIAESMRVLGKQYYTHRQIDTALKFLLGVDTQLIEEGTYYVVETEAGEIAGCGGWSCHHKLFGADQTPLQTLTSTDFSINGAVIRAFFVHPNWARKGVGTRLLRTCEMVARRAGFRRLELAATLVGLPLYLKRGYRPVEDMYFNLPDGEVFPAVRMVKDLSTTYPSGR